MTSRVRVLLPLIVCAVVLSACTTDSAADDDAVEQTEQAYSGPVPGLEGTRAPRNAPSVWPQPPSEGLFGQYGYCGATAAANTLAWYGPRVSPRQAIDNGCWSAIGTTPSHLAQYMQNNHGDLGCSYERFDRNGDALGYLKSLLTAGRMVMIQYMVGRLNAHWVPVVGVRGRGTNTRLVVMSDGGYYTAEWEKMKEAWKNGWGGPFPHVVCNARVTGPRAQGLWVE